jgi:predicted HAD superfamily phosphohydrolase
MMPSTTKPNNATEKNAQKYFRKAEQSDTTLKHDNRTERAKAAGKTAKLRELRLAKERVDNEELERIAAEKAKNGVPATRKRVEKVKPPAMIRMTY